MSIDDIGRMLEPTVDVLVAAALVSGEVGASAGLANRPKRVFITAAEVSGDKHAAQFVRSLKELLPGVIVEGVGGPEMEAAGVIVHRNTVTHAAMGIRGVFRAGEIYRVLRWTRKRFAKEPPDLWVGVDSPSMNFHFAKAAKLRGIPTLQFVAPQLWAWAIWRMKKLRRWVDRVACILPFEERFFHDHGVKATFVGHPLFDELPPNRQPVGERFPAAAPVMAILAGSRKGVAQANFPRHLEVVRTLLAEFPTLSFLVPTTDATDPIIRRLLADSGLPADRFTIERGAFDRMMPRCDLCLTVSGTATLHVASYGVPMVVVYAGSALMWNLLGRWLIKMRTYAMVNLLADPTPLEPDPNHVRHLVPEFVPWYGSTLPVSEALASLLRDPSALSRQRQRLDEMVRRLDEPGASTAVAKLAAEMMKVTIPTPPG